MGLYSVKNKVFKFWVLLVTVCFAFNGVGGVFATSAIDEQHQEDKQVVRFRRHLVNSFERENDGKKINFNDSKIDYYAKLLEKKMREFLNERRSLTWQQFYNSCFDYLKGDQNHHIKVLNRAEFENFCKLNSNEKCRLFVGVKSGVFADEFKQGRIFSDKAKKYFLADESTQIKQPFSQYIYPMTKGSSSGYSGLAVFECFQDALLESREFDEGQLVFPGFVGELVVRNLNVVDADFLFDVLAVIKYNNPQEFGFVNEIEHYFNEDDESKKLIKIESEEYKNKDKAKQKAQDCVDSKYYDHVLYYVFSNENQIRNELFKQKTGEDVEYADVVLKFNDEQSKQYYDKFDAALGQDWFSKQVELGFESSFKRNKTLALMENYGVLAKLLGFDAVKVNDRANTGYILVNWEKVDAVCAELKASGCDEFEVERVPLGCL